MPKLTTDIRNHLLNGNTLLDSDPDYIQAERDEMKIAVRDETLERLKKRIVALEPAPVRGSNVIGGGPEKPGPVILLVPEDQVGRKILKDVELKSQTREQ